MKHLCALVLLLTSSLNAQVQVEALPESGIQPQVVMTGSGLVHVVYLKGDPKGCDIRHATRKAAGGAWSAPVTVNSVPRSAIAAGTIRGAQIALGKDDSLQVIWNGSTSGKGAKQGQAPLLHARLLPGAREFTPQQDLLGETTALDGGASIAANDKGHVAVVWHASPAGASEERSRLVWVRYSADDGGIFSPPASLNPSQHGVCACCSLRAHLASDDTLSVLYRAATAPKERGMHLITSKSGRATLRKLDDWNVAMCPMSSASLVPEARGLRAAWENQGRIITALLSETASKNDKTGADDAKHPVLAQNNRGQTLIASVTGSGWAKAGRLHWELLDAKGKSMDSGDGEKLPVWSYAAAYARPDGSFVILQ
ncbi:MAG: hypothetical protein CJBNEKGG_00678 [Prosthecobacter sp.]|nr:hypothetical protein [Prosthecobacter sp.]